MNKTVRFKQLHVNYKKLYESQYFENDGDCHHDFRRGT